ncbi:MAG: hypothetical protein M1333_01235 [Patescibacteria group bacterium]|nr:hypothetical protein [Patescibacteria group bacterium]
MTRTATFVCFLLFGLLILTLGYDAYDRRQRRLVVFAAIDPEVRDINLPELKTVRGLLESRLQDLDANLRINVPDLEPGSLEVVVFPYSEAGAKAVYLVLVRYHGEAFGFTVMDNPDLARAAETAAFDIRVDIARFLAFRRHELQRPGRLTARGVFV